MVEVGEVVVVVKVVESAAGETDVGNSGLSQPESEVEETDMGDCGGSWTTGAGTCC